MVERVEERSSQLAEWVKTIETGLQDVACMLAIRKASSNKLPHSSLCLLISKFFSLNVKCAEVRLNLPTLILMFIVQAVIGSIQIWCLQHIEIHSDSCASSVISCRSGIFMICLTLLPPYFKNWQRGKDKRKSEAVRHLCSFHFAFDCCLIHRCYLFSFYSV